MSKLLSNKNDCKNDFNHLQYINNYDDLKKANINTYEKAYEHWINHGIKEGRTYKNIKTRVNDNIFVSLHIGNYDIFNDMYNNYKLFFTRKNVHFFITLHKENIHCIDEIKKKLTNTDIEIIENIGCDIGGFIKNCIRILKSPLYDSIEYIYILHTKTDNRWRKKLLDAILLEFKKNELELNYNFPFIFGSNKYKYNNIKGINRETILNFYNRNKDIFLKHNISSELEISKYFYDYIDDFYNDNKKLFLLNNKFYSYIEKSLKETDPIKLENHWNYHGINEYHRLQSPNLIKKNGIDNYFIAGTIFMCNKHYFDFFKNFTDEKLEIEFSLLDKGYVKNYIPTNTHMWEYFFGLLTHILNGDIFTDGKIKTNNKIIYYKQSIINIPANKVIGAIFLPIVYNNCCGGYRTLLKYIEFLRINNINVDIYFGNTSTDYNTDTIGYGVNKQDIDEIIKITDSYNELSIGCYNYYLGLFVRRKYNFILSNAWQISEAVYKNKMHCNKLGYIIQDLEYLFYDDHKMEKVIKDTYKNDYYYYCLSNFLSEHFKQYSTNIYRSQLCVDLNVYYNINENRENAVIIAYYKKKKGRLPQLVEKIINILIKNKIKCYIFPDCYNKSEYTVNLKTLTPKQLNEYYNKVKVGIVFSNTNPSRLGFEMAASGLHVIEYNSEFTKYDLPDHIFTKINNETNIVNIINNLFDAEYYYDKEYIKSIDIKNELNNILNFTKQLIL